MGVVAARQELTKDKKREAEGKPEQKKLER